MLSDHETAQLRANALRGQHRRVGKRIPATFHGGPLDRMTIAIEAMAARSYRLAWAHVRDTGVVQACLSPVVGHGVKRVLAALARVGRVGRECCGGIVAGG